MEIPRVRQIHKLPDIKSEAAQREHDFVDQNWLKKHEIVGSTSITIILRADPTIDIFLDLNITAQVWGKIARPSSTNREEPVHHRHDLERDATTNMCNGYQLSKQQAAYWASQ